MIELIAAAVIGLTPGQRYWMTLLEPSSRPASIAECERAGVRRVVATYNLQLRGTNIYHRRICLSIKDVET